MPRLILLFLSSIIFLSLHAYDSRVIITEDFSRMVLGNIDVPYSKPINVTPEGNFLPDTLMSIPGWSGEGLYEGLEMVALKFVTDPYGRRRWGYLDTPPLHLGGDVTITVDSRRLAGSRGSLGISIFSGDLSEPMLTEYFDPTNNMHTFTFRVKDLPAAPKTIIRFEAEGGAIFIDNIKIEFTRKEIVAPTNLTMTNNSSTSFTARWDDMIVDDYLVNIFKQTVSADAESGVLSEGFDDASLSDWTLSDTEMTTEPAYCGQSAPAVALTQVGASLTSAELSLPVTQVGFHVVPVVDISEALGVAMMRVDVHRADTRIWEPVYYVSTYDCHGSGSDIQIYLDTIGPHADAVRFVLIDNYNNGFYIDDITIDYASEPQIEYIVTDRVVADTAIMVEGLDDSEDYYISVASRDQNVVSEFSSAVWFDGIIGLKVSDIYADFDEVGNIAVWWSPVSRADDYLLSISKILFVDDDTHYDVVMFEDEFADGPEMSLWQATNPDWTDDCIGTTGMTSTGVPGIIYSPNVNLGCDAGRGFFFEAVINTEFDDIRLDLMYTVHDNHPIISTPLPCPENGTNAVRVWVDTQAVDDLSDVIIAITSAGGHGFFIDKLCVTQNILNGETFEIPCGVPVITDNTSIELSDVPRDADHLIRVVARRVRGHETYVSSPSEAVEVRTVSVSSPQIENNDPVTDSSTYDLQGRPVAPATPGIYIRRKGATIEKIILR